MKRNRSVIYPKDVQVITGLGLRQAQKMVRKIRRALGKQRHQFVTIGDFCQFSGMTREDVEKYL